MTGCAKVFYYFKAGNNDLAGTANIPDDVLKICFK
jgi:hypothetical protein